MYYLLKSGIIMKKNLAKLPLAASMAVFGTIGIFVHYINMPSALIAFVRGALGALFLIATAYISKKKLSGKAIRKNLFILIASGACIGVNWILLFESYRYTTVAAATLCYYFAPIFVIIASPVVLKEKLDMKKICCVGTAILGMVFVSGVITGGFTGIRGILLALGAALFYATVILFNKKAHDIAPTDMTAIQLAAAAAVVLPYSLICEDIGSVNFAPLPVILLLIVGIVHTGIAYVLYFGSVNKLPSGTIAVFSYIDPILSVILSALILKEAMTVYTVIGAVLILGATFVSEFEFKKK